MRLTCLWFIWMELLLLAVTIFIKLEKLILKMPFTAPIPALDES